MLIACSCEEKPKVYKGDVQRLLSEINTLYEQIPTGYINMLSGALTDETTSRYSATPRDSSILALFSSLSFNITRSEELLKDIKDEDISHGVKNQLIGEVYFIKAYCHYYFTSFFGLEWGNRKTEVGKLLQQELINAEKFIGDEYRLSDRTSPNKAAVLTMLARLFLTAGYYEDAEFCASQIIDAGNYSLAKSFSADEIFKETIWFGKKHTQIELLSRIKFTCSNLPCHTI